MNFDMWDFSDELDLDNVFNESEAAPNPETTETEPVVEPATTETELSATTEAKPTTTEADSEVSPIDVDLDTIFAEAGEDDETNEDSATTELDSENFYLDVAKQLTEANILNLDEEKLTALENTPEALQEAVDAEINRRFSEAFEDFSSKLPEEGLALLKHIQEGGRVSDFKEVYSQAADIDSLDMNNIAHQKEAIRMFLLEKGLGSKADIEEELELYEDSELLGKKSAFAIAKLKEIKKAKTDALNNQRAAAARAAEELQQKTVSLVTSKIEEAEDIKGYPISTADKRKLKDYVTKPVHRYKDPNTNEITYLTQYQRDELDRQEDVNVFLFKALQSMKNYSLAPVEKSAVTRTSRKMEENYKKRKGSDTKSNYSQSSKSSNKRKYDPFEELFNK